MRFVGEEANCGFVGASRHIQTKNARSSPVTGSRVFVSTSWRGGFWRGVLVARILSHFLEFLPHIFHPAVGIRNPLY
jgi:hypothetical protein